MSIILSEEKAKTGNAQWRFGVKSEKPGKNEVGKEKWRKGGRRRTTERLGKQHSPHKHTHAHTHGYFLFPPETILSMTLQLLFHTITPHTTDWTDLSTAIAGVGVERRRERVRTSTAQRPLFAASWRALRLRDLDIFVCVQGAETPPSGEEEQI